MIEDVFPDIYRRNRWNGVESKSGPGSGSAATQLIRQAITEMVAELGVASVLDVACGDGFWMPDLPGYVGMDIVPEAIATARRRHPDRTYALGDARFVPVRAFDLVVCRDAMQHLPLADVSLIIANLRASGSRWLLASTYRGSVNVNVPAGGFYCPNLEAEPFLLGEPVRLIFDGYGYARPDVRDPAKHLGLWMLTPGID
jgi:SAM-dependent methyltransferase